MKAVVLASVESEELMPICFNSPKAMLRLLGKPVIEYDLDMLKAFGVDEVFIKTSFFETAILEHFKKNSYRGIPIRFFKSAEEIKDEIFGDILILDGGCIYNTHLENLYKAHKASGAKATLAVKKTCDKGKRERLLKGENIKRSQKNDYTSLLPDREYTGLMVTGALYLEKVLDGGVPPFSPEDIEAVEYEGYFCFLDSVKELITCQREMLSGKGSFITPGSRDEYGNIILSDIPLEDIIIDSPIFIGENVEIKPGAYISSGSVLEDRAYIGRKAKIKDSLVLRGAHIGDMATLNGCVACEGAYLKSGVSAFEGSILGEGCAVGEDAIVLPLIKIWPYKETSDRCVLKDHVKTSFKSKKLFEEGVYMGDMGKELSPEFFARLGRAVGSLSKNKRVGVASAHQKGFSSFKEAVASGALSAGADAIDFGELFESQFVFCLGQIKCDIGVFIYSDGKCAVKLFSDCGLPVDERAEDKVEELFFEGNFNIKAPNEFGERLDFKDMQRLYKSRVCSFAFCSLKGVEVDIKSTNRLVKNECIEIFKALGASVSEKAQAVLHINSGATELSICHRELGLIPFHKILSVLMLAVFALKDEDVALWDEYTEKGKEIAAPFGKEVLSFKEEKGKLQAEKQPYLRDALMSAVMLFSFLRLKNISLKDIWSLVPGEFFIKKTFSLNGDRASFIKALWESGSAFSENGIRVKQKDAKALLKLSRREDILKVFVFSEKEETAAELCRGIENILQGRP